MAKKGILNGHIEKPTQRDEVLSFMREFGSISTFDAYQELGITQLGARIKELENKGWDIGRNKRAVISKRTGKKVHFVEYFIKVASV